MITQYNGKPVVDSNQLRNEVSSTAPGSTITLQLLARWPLGNGEGHAR